MKFDGFMDVLKPQLEKLAKDTVQEEAEAALESGLGFIQSMQSDVSDWLNDLQNGDLSPEDFEDLMRGEQDLMNITLLTEKGLPAARIERFQKAVVDCVVSTAKAAV